MIRVSFGSRHAGLANVGFTLFNTDGSVRQVRTVVGVRELGGGDYGAPDPAPFDGYIEWDSGEVMPVVAREERSLPLAQDPDQAAVFAALTPERIARLDKLGTAEVNIVSPLGRDLVLRTVRGDDYLLADGRALEWLDTGGSWPDLTGASVSLQGGARGRTVTAPAVAGVTPAGTPHVTVDLLGSQTDGLPVGHYSYRLVAVLASGGEVTLARGDWYLT